MKKSSFFLLYFFFGSWQILFAMDLLVENLRKAVVLEEKIHVLDAHPLVQQFLQKTPDFLNAFPLEYQAIGKQLLAINQWEKFVADTHQVNREDLERFLSTMSSVDSFYREIGGIVGYQHKILQLLHAEQDDAVAQIAALHAPAVIDITKHTPEVCDAIHAGIAALPEMVEMYPLGGAADRLHLVDENSGFELPAAKLEYAGITLVEGLFRDLAAREYLYYKLYGKQVETPVAIMTSKEKDNYQHVLRICTDAHWFHRNRDSFRLFIQPLVPTVDAAGDWCVAGPCAPVLKPGGHGALWKMARDEGIFAWFRSLGRKKALVRQVNNPIAGLDYGLLAFSGFGFSQDKIFGFASCPRLVQAAEGFNVIVEKKNKEIALTNIEYCDFAKYGIPDCPLEEGGLYSRFPSNTNILFADIDAVERAVEINPFPGLLINLKNGSYTTVAGEKLQKPMARLESTMQNIADAFVEAADHDAEQQTTKRTFITYNQRNKTIATAKKAFVPGQPVKETPEECFYVQMQSARQLLEEHCHMRLPARYELAQYLEEGPDVLFLYHPALGPLYSIIGQKIQGGSLARGAELQLDISDLQIENLDLDGSLIVKAEQPMGHFDAQGILRYSDKTGRCTLRNVSICNAGVHWQESKPYWKNRLARKEAVEICLHGHSEFVAENVSFVSAHRFDVPDGMRWRVFQQGDEMTIQEELLTAEEPFWEYKWEERRGCSCRRSNEKL